MSIKFSFKSGQEFELRSCYCFLFLPSYRPVILVGLNPSSDRAFMIGQDILVAVWTRPFWHGNPFTERFAII